MAEILKNFAVCCFLLLGCSACASFPLTAKGECQQRGYPEGSEGYARCREAIRAQIARDERNNVEAGAAAALIMMAGSGYSKAGSSYPTSSPGNLAPLVNQYVQGENRVCVYKGSTTLLNSIVPVGVLCPSAMVQ